MKLQTLEMLSSKVFVINVLIHAKIADWFFKSNETFIHSYYTGS